MKADFSRPTFNTLAAPKHYVGVLQQQGRVSLDSDVNDDVFERLTLLEQETADIVGACGAPDPGTAFQISRNFKTNSAPDDFQISGGLGPAGRYYVDGLLAQLDQTCSYLSQPDFPHPPRIGLPASAQERVQAIVYLEVWQRLVTYLQDDALREVALGGPDTGTRIKTVAQVKVLPVPFGESALTCAAAAQLLPGPGQGTLTTLQPSGALPADECRIPDLANYTGVENHLYRVEIDSPGDVAGSGSASLVDIKLAGDAGPGAVSLTLAAALTADQADALVRTGVARLSDDDGHVELVTIASASGPTVNLAGGLNGDFRTELNATLIGGVARFKWSRDNAGFAERVTAISADRLKLTLAGLGRDQATALRGGDLVEISDDTTDLGPGTGFLTYLTVDPDPDAFTASLAGPLPNAFVTGGQPDSHLLLRRWDGAGWAALAFDQAATPDMDLGDGVHIQFGGSDLRPGDYWQFAARSTDGSLDALSSAPPMGIQRHRCPLAIVRWEFDIQLKVEQVIGLFTIAQLSPSQSANLQKLLHDSGKPLFGSGDIDRFIVQLHLTSAQAAAVHQALARLQGEIHPQLVFRVVEDCRQRFLPLTKLKSDPGIHVLRVLALDANHQPAHELRNDDTLTADELANGLIVECDAAVAQASISRPTSFVTAEVPFAVVPEPLMLAFQQVTLVADVGANGSTIFWNPASQPVAGLAQLAGRTLQGDKGVLMRLILKGRAIWGQDDPTLYLDGEAFGFQEPGGNTTDIRYPSGDGKRGGDFELWFWLARPVVRAIGILVNLRSQVMSPPPARQFFDLVIDRSQLSPLLPAGYQISPTRQDLNKARDLAGQLNLGQHVLAGWIPQRYAPVQAPLAAALSSVGVRSTWTVIPDDQFVSKVQVAVAAGQGPDFVVADDALAGQLAAAMAGVFDPATIVRF